MRNYNNRYDDNEIHDLTAKERMHVKAQMKRKKDQMAIVAIGLILYSLVLVAILVGSYVGFKMLFTSEDTTVEADNETDEIVEDTAGDTETNTLENVETDEIEVIEEVAEEAGEWKDLVFSRLEKPSDSANAPINKFDFSRKSYITEEGNVINYDIYTNPESKKIEKITSYTATGDVYEIRDFYYDDGDVNYVSEYTESITLPVNIASSMVKSRYYFADDKMVRYIYCEDDNATEYTKADFKIYSEGTIEQYKYLEKDILEKSKENLERVNELSSIETVKGFVLDEYNQPLFDVAIIMYDEDNNVVAETSTDGDGRYSLEIETSDKKHRIEFIKDTLHTVKYYDVYALDGSKTYYAETVYMSYENNEQLYNSQIFIKDADDINVIINDGSVKFRDGFNNRDGEIFLTGSLGEAGQVIAPVRAGNYTIEVEREGYFPLFFNFSVNTIHQATIEYISKVINDNEIKCVLNFETTPLDLDIRAITSNNVKTYKSINDSVGSTACETIFVNSVGTDTYKVYVSNYTDIVGGDQMSYRLSKSRAKIAVYNCNGLVTYAYVPEASAGVVWNPLEIRNGKVINVGDYYNSIGENSLFTNK